MRRVVLLALVVGLWAAPSAGAITIRYDDGTPATALQRWADASYVPVAAGVVTVHRASCYDGGAGSCTTSPGDDLWLYAPAHGLREDFAHELGHRFDFQVMTDRARDVFRGFIHNTGPWWAAADSAAWRNDEPGEQFAEAYSKCFRHRVIHHNAGGGYGYTPGPTLHRRACRLIRLAAAGVFG